MTLPGPIWMMTRCSEPKKATDFCDDVLFQNYCQQLSTHCTDWDSYEKTLISKRLYILLANKNASLRKLDLFQIKISQTFGPSGK